ncbi:hypothetical protein, partial [Sutterella wadsworthensis]|uniref:hypothetical protein n=1 Tax=Sutterella wadsworthensis TaxID=40545 RepID=UPI00242ED342
HFSEKKKSRKNLLVHFHGISSAKQPILDLNHSSSGSVIREFRYFMQSVDSSKEIYLLILGLMNK